MEIDEVELHKKVATVVVGMCSRLPKRLSKHNKNKFKATIANIINYITIVIREASEFANWLGIKCFVDEFVCTGLDLDLSKGVTFFGRALSCIRNGSAEGISEAIVNKFYEFKYGTNGTWKENAPYSRLNEGTWNFGRFVEAHRNIMAKDMIQHLETHLFPYLLSLAQHLARKKTDDEGGTIKVKEARAKAAAKKMVDMYKLVDQAPHDNVFAEKYGEEIEILAGIMNPLVVATETYEDDSGKLRHDKYSPIQRAIHKGLLLNASFKTLGRLANSIHCELEQVDTAWDEGEPSGVVGFFLRTLGLTQTRRRPWWNAERPKRFQIFPLCKLKPRYIHVSKTIGDCLRKMLRVKGEKSPWDWWNGDEAFWWKDLFELDSDDDRFDENTKANKVRRRKDVNERNAVYVERWFNRKRKRSTRWMQKPLMIPGLRTKPYALDEVKAIKRPWIATGFLTNGKELHVHLESRAQCDAGISDEHRRSMPGSSELNKRGYTSLDSVALNLNEVALNLDESSSSAGVLPKGHWGVHGSVNPLPTGTSVENLADLIIRAVLLDPGQIHFIATSQCDITVGSNVNSPDMSELEGTWEALQEESWLETSGQQRRTVFEKNRREKNKEYAAALRDFRGTSKTACDLGQFRRYLQVCGKHQAVLLKECLLWERRTLKFSVKMQRQRALSVLANHIKGKGDVCFFGKGIPRGKGHVKVPVKALVRAIARVMPVMMIDEWGTSSRCPVCRSGEKLESRKTSDFWAPGEGEGEGKEEEDESEMSDNDGSLNVLAAPPQEINTSSNTDGIPEFVFINFGQIEDDRVEYCGACNPPRRWLHDVLPMPHFACIADAKLNGRDRPWWIDRPSFDQSS
jgi:hypothetical protein